MQRNDKHFISMRRAKLCRAHMSKIMKEENEWDQIADNNTVLGPVDGVMRK